MFQDCCCCCYFCSLLFDVDENDKRRRNSLWMKTNVPFVHCQGYRVKIQSKLFTTTHLAVTWPCRCLHRSHNVVRQLPLLHCLCSEQWTKHADAHYFSELTRRINLSLLNLDLASGLSFTLMAVVYINAHSSASDFFFPRTFDDLHCLFWTLVSDSESSSNGDAAQKELVLMVSHFVCIRQQTTCPTVQTTDSNLFE